jgi:RNA polymerase sigma-70 factor (ECF subfamily)
MNHQPLADSVSDDELLPRIAAGDAAAFTALFRRRQTDVYRFALHMTGLPAVAEDVTQDVFLAVIRDAGRYQRGRSTVTAWLCGIARNHALRRWDRERGPGKPVQLDADDDEPAHDTAAHPSVLDDLTTAEQIEALHKAVLTLPVRYREAVVLCDLQELTYAEAAVVLGCVVGTVRSRLHRGRALLASKMRGDDPIARDVPATAGGRFPPNRPDPGEGGGVTNRAAPADAGHYSGGRNDRAPAHAAKPITRCIT